MDLLALWHMVQRRWWLMLLPALVVFLLTLPSIPTILNPETSYNVALRFTAAAPSDIADDETYEDRAYVPWLASEYVVVNMPQWITSDSFAREVETVLNDDTLTAEAIRPAFNADSARSVFVLIINWDDANQIDDLAEAAITVLQTRNQDYFPQFASAPATIEPLDDVRVNAVATPLTNRLDPFIRIAIGLMLGIGLAAIVEYMDDTIHTDADVTALDMTLLGVLPRHN